MTALVEQWMELETSLKLADDRLTELEEQITTLKAERAEFLGKMKADTIPEAREKIQIIKQKLMNAKTLAEEEATAMGIL